MSMGLTKVIKKYIIYIMNMKKFFITFSIFLLLIGFGVFATPNKTEASFWDYFSVNIGYNDYGGYDPYYGGGYYDGGYGYNDYYGGYDSYYGGYGYDDYNSYNGYGGYVGYGNSYDNYYGGYGYDDYSYGYNNYYPNSSYGYGYNNNYYSGDANYPAYGQRGYQGGYAPCSMYCGR